MPAGHMETARRMDWYPPEALLWNSDQLLADRVPTSRVKTTLTAARLNQEVCRDTGTGLVPALQALGQRSRRTCCQLTLR